MNGKLDPRDRKFLKEVERLSGVDNLQLQITGGSHRKISLPNGHFTIAAKTGDSYSLRTTAAAIKRMLRKEV